MTSFCAFGSRSAGTSSSAHKHRRRALPARERDAQAARIGGDERAQRVAALELDEVLVHGRGPSARRRGRASRLRAASDRAVETRSFRPSSESTARAASASVGRTRMASMSKRDDADGDDATAATTACHSNGDDPGDDGEDQLG